MSIIKLGSETCSWLIPNGFLNHNSVVYCAGAGEDISFEVELANRYGCHVYILDPTPRAQEHWEKRKQYYNIHNDSLLHFYPFGISDFCGQAKFYKPKNSQHVSHSVAQISNDYIIVEMKTPDYIMQMLGHKAIDLFKMDIEHSEYKVIPYFLDKGIAIDCFCVEFHAEIMPVPGYNILAVDNNNYTYKK